MRGTEAVASIVLALAPFVAAVAGESVVQLSPDTYMALCDSKAGAFASMATLKAKAIALANDFASKHGKVAIAISTKETRAVPFTFRWPSVEYQFRLVDPSDPTAKPTALSVGKNGLSESIDPSTAPPETSSKPAEKEDIYSQLLKLEELRQKGIITQAEFDAQKLKILSSE